MMGNQPLFFHLMLKQGFNWFTLTKEDQEADEVKFKKDYTFQKNGQRDQPCLQFYLWVNTYRTPDGHGTDNKDGKRHIHTEKRPYI